MCGSKNCGRGCCTMGMIGKVLVIVGGVNWGLVGLGMLFGAGDWNVVRMILGSVPVLEGLLYLLVGIAAVMMIFGCKCKKCMGSCDSGTCSPDGKTEEGM